MDSETVEIINSAKRWFIYIGLSCYTFGVGIGVLVGYLIWGRK
jgi:hypothetical protein